MFILLISLNMKEGFRYVPDVHEWPIVIFTAIAMRQFVFLHYNFYQCPFFSSKSSQKCQLLSNIITSGTVCKIIHKHVNHSWSMCYTRYHFWAIPEISSHWITYKLQDNSNRIQYPECTDSSDVRRQNVWCIHT